MEDIIKWIKENWIGAAIGGVIGLSASLKVQLPSFLNTVIGYVVNIFSSLLSKVPSIGKYFIQPLGCEGICGVPSFTILGGIGLIFLGAFIQSKVS